MLPQKARFAFILIAICSSQLATSQKDWELGPFVKQDAINPIMGPRNDTMFHCPIRGEYLLWEEKDVFNPTAVVRGGKVYMLYRAEDTVGQYAGTSRIGVAVSDDGLNFYRFSSPVLAPRRDEFYIYEWEGGCEDPRIVEDANGTYYMTYTAYNGSEGQPVRLSVASSVDLLVWRKHGPVFREAEGGKWLHMNCKSGSIVSRAQAGDRFVAEMINGKYWMYFGDTSMYVATSEDLINWTPVEDTLNGDPNYHNLTAVFTPRDGMFDSDLVEPGPQAMIINEGILLVYNSRNRNETTGGDPEVGGWSYSVGQALMNVSNPIQMIDRCENYTMTPDKDYEMIGQVNNVVFLEGLVRFMGTWFGYYGTADSYIAVTTAVA